MLTHRQDIYYITGKGGLKRLFTYRPWMTLAPLIILFASLALNIALTTLRRSEETLRGRADEARKALAEQTSRSLRLWERLEAMRAEVARIESFNEKLGVMVDVAPGRAAGSEPGQGAPSPLFGLNRQNGATRRMNEFLAQLAARIALEEVTQQELTRLLRDRKLEFLARPSLWPLRGFITSGFGPRPSPFGRGGDFHNGVDIKAPIGTPVYSAGAGRVIEVDWMGGYGLRVVVEHDYGLRTVYAHLKSAEVKPGQEVKRGQRIALSGNSGRTTGTHLHYEVQVQEKPVNPLKYMLD